jgi:hypothetical protein
MFNTIIGVGAVGAGAVSLYGSGSGTDQMMRLLAAPAPQHLFLAWNRSVPTYPGLRLSRRSWPGLTV